MVTQVDSSYAAEGEETSTEAGEGGHIAWKDLPSALADTLENLALQDPVTYPGMNCLIV